MTIIKATAGSTFRKLTLPADISYPLIAAKLLSIFPNEKGLFYIDSDGDIMTIASTEELTEALQGKQTLKIGVGQVSEDKLKLLRGSGSVAGSVIGGEGVLDFSPFNAGEKNAAPPSYPKVPEVPVAEQKEEPKADDAMDTTPDTKTKKEEQSKASSSNDTKDESKESNEKPFEGVKQSFDDLLNTIQTITQQHPELFEQANRLMTQIIEGLPIDEGLEKLFAGMREGQAFPFPWGAGHGWGAGNGWGAGHRWGRRHHPCGPWARQGSCRKGPMWWFTMGGEADTNISNEELEKRTTTVQELLGFTEDNETVKELLKRYNGNIERVVELCLRKRSEKGKGASTEE